MITKQKLTLTSFFLLFVCLAWVPSSVFSQSEAAQVKAGHIVVGSGRLIARGADGTERRLRRRAAVYAGDTIVVGKNAFVQIRFTDGGLFSLRPDSEFKVSEYRHQEQKDENGKVVFELLKGGLRTISGSIGKKDKENYQLKTPVSTIGIRGTHYGVRLCTGNCTSPQGDPMPDGLYGGVVDGAISVKNQSGEGIIGNDQYFHVSAMDAPMESLLAPPGVVFDPAVNGQDLETEPQPGDEPPPPGDEPPPPGDEPPPPGEGSASEGDAVAPLADFPPPDDAELLVVNTPEDNAFAIDEAPKDPTAGTTKKPLEDDAGSSAALIDPKNATSTLQTLTSNLTPAPPGSAAVMAIGGHFDPEGHLEPTDPANVIHKLFIDKNNNVINVWHEESPDCLPCTVNKGMATLVHDGMPAGGFTMLHADEKIYWGRWVDGWYGQKNGDAGPRQGSWHFMYSPNVTTKADLDMLKFNNVNATFTQVSAADGTRPTDEAGNLGTFVSMTSMSVNFGMREISGYTVHVGGFGTGRDFVGTQRDSIVPFSGPKIDFDLDVSCSGCATTAGVGRSDIVFVGTNASHAINSFEMHTNDGVNRAVGTVHMKR